MARRLATVAAIALCACLGAGRYAAELAGSGRPARAGTVRLPGLEGPVEVRFDPQGVPHVRAEGQSDLARALGYLHANDRAFQMELGRRAAAGRLSELIGAAALELDVRARTLGLRAAAAGSVEVASARSRLWLEAYAAGVNAWFRARGDDLPPEFRLLGLRPEPWTPVDSASFALLMARDLSQPGSTERTHLTWARAVGMDGLGELLGLEDVHAPDGLFDWLAARAPAAGTRERGPESDPPVRGGSNNWAVGAERSASGAPLLAGDPHLRLRLPAQFFMARLSAPGVEAFGATLPGHPALVIGRSADRAWSLTTTGLDDDDLTLEELSEAGDAVRRADGWRPLVTRDERFGVRFGDTVERTVRASDRGPLLEAEPDADDLRAFPRSLSWTALAPSDGLEPFLALVLDPEREQVRAALADFVAPAQNLLVAERDGGTWYTVLGRPPVRPRGDGRLPSVGAAPGYAWDGLAPRSALPTVEAGPDAALWTANADVRPPDFEGELFARWAPPDRADRIGAVLGSRQRWTTDAFAELQLDLRSRFALRLVASLRDGDADGDPAAEAALARLRGFDGTLRGGDAALLALCVQTLAEAIFDEPLHPERLAGPDARRLESALVRVLEGRAGGHWFDRVDTPAVEGRAATVAAGLAAGLELGRELFGTDAVGEWDLAHLQTLRLEHPLSALPGLGALLDRGPFGVAGHGSTVNALWRRWTGRGWRVVGGASLRFVTDVGHPVDTRHVQPGGQSGHPFDPHYDDQLEAWLGGKSFPAPWERPTADPARTLRLLPGP